jgi:hypothetical protein
MESIRKIFSTLAAFVARSIGMGVGGVFLFISLFSLPLNVIAIMRIKGWDWWPALIGAVVLGIVPVFGQLAFIVLTFVGAYFLVEAKFDWREATASRPQIMADRLRHCVNADVPAYGNMQDRADKELQWLRAHKKEYLTEVEKSLGRQASSSVEGVDFDNPEFSAGFRLTFHLAHAAGCSEYEKQLATGVATIDSCIYGNVSGVGQQLLESLGPLPDFESKDPSFVLGSGVGAQQGVVDGCMLADALKSSGY